jgi:pimeloyl-ACP methyl ester carboxylesterase
MSAQSKLIRSRPYGSREQVESLLVKFIDRVSGGSFLKILLTAASLIVGILITDASALAQPDIGSITEEVTFNNGDIKLAGTLTFPSDGRSHPAVVLFSGSGPQDRDGAIKTIPGYRPFAVIAEHLAHNGFAVLRYDDRGVGESTGDYIEATELDFISDAEAALRYLAGRKEIDSKQVGVLGHSEGSLIGAQVATSNPQVAFVISLAGGAVDGYTLLLRQAERQAQAKGMSKEKVTEAVKEQSRIFDLVIAKEWEELTEVVSATILKRLEALPEEKKTAIGDLDSFAKNRASRSVSAFQHPRYQYLLRHDFGEDWAKVTVPVLALFGELDVQVDAAQNKAALQQILARAGNDDVTIVIVPAANHLFVKARTGSMGEYATLPKDLAPGVLELISSWLRDKVDTKEGTEAEPREGRL